MAWWSEISRIVLESEFCSNCYILFSRNVGDRVAGWQIFDTIKAVNFPAPTVGWPKLDVGRPTPAVVHQHQPSAAQGPSFSLPTPAVGLPTSAFGRPTPAFGRPTPSFGRPTATVGPAANHNHNTNHRPSSTNLLKCCLTINLQREELLLRYKQWNVNLY